jgi:hypothetical protein
MRLSRKERELRTRLLELDKTLPEDEQKLSKEQIRRFHEYQRYCRLVKLDGSFNDVLMLLQKNLANPGEIEIGEIRPRLIPVRADTVESRLFFAATLYWSVPVSGGFGRRLRFIVRDESNGKLIGIIGLTDPVFNLGPRDKWVGWSCDERKDGLVHAMDAFVLGALPPYSKLLGGKLIALLATSREVVKYFRAKYGKSKGIISKRKKNPRLVLLTTTSALGRSSVYNRLRIPGSVEYLTGVEPDRVARWYTKGYGHFHISESVYKALVEVLSKRNHPYATGNRFGDGPNWKIRVIRQASVELGIEPRLLRHGIQRQVYIVPLAENTRSFLLGKSKVVRYKTLPVWDITDFWCERWAKPRSRRCPDWVDWNSDEVIWQIQVLRSKGSSLGELRGIGEF